MAPTKEQLILFSAQQDNILPLTSACNVKCVFCSHHQNPAGVQVYGIGHRSLADVAMTLEFIDPTRKIVIGESVTRIMEGEPFLHPEVETILRSIRERFPETPIQITTNGILLSDRILDLLEELGKIELYISLNSATPEGREQLMGDRGDEVRRAVSQLRGRGIPFQGSIVAMPWMVGWDDLEATVRFLDEHGAETIRIFMPGYTDKAPEELRFDAELPQQLAHWAREMQSRYRTPLTLEPAFLKDLRAVVEGVTQDSPAADAGFQRGDEILAIEGVKPFSRVEAFHTLLKGGCQEVRVWRSSADACGDRDGGYHLQGRSEQANGREMRLTLEKERGARSGLVFAYDLHPDVCEQVLALIRQHRAKRTLLMTSVLAAPVVEELARVVEAELHAGLEGDKPLAYTVHTVPVPNRFYGGSIMAGGLLVLQDFLDQWANLPDPMYDLVLVPGIFLDPWGRDLTGRHGGELEEEIGVAVEMVEI